MDRIKYFLVNSRLLLVPFIILVSIFFSNKYYNQLDKKTLWFIGFLTGIVSFFVYLFVVYNLDWWLYE